MKTLLRAARLNTLIDALTAEIKPLAAQALEERDEFCGLNARRYDQLRARRDRLVKELLQLSHQPKKAEDCELSII